MVGLETPWKVELKLHGSKLNCWSDTGALADMKLTLFKNNDLGL